MLQSCFFFFFFCPTQDIYPRSGRSLFSSADSEKGHSCFISSELDCCRALCSGIRSTNIQRRRRLLPHHTNLSCPSLVTRELFRIDFKIFTACFESLGTVSCCTCDPLTPCEPGRCWTSSDKNLLVVSTSWLADKRRPLVPFQFKSRCFVLDPFFLGFSWITLTSYCLFHMRSTLQLLFSKGYRQIKSLLLLFLSFLAKTAVPWETY